MVLGLHSSEATLSQLPARIQDAVDLGFDEVTISLPWDRGIDEAVEAFSGIADPWR